MKDERELIEGLGGKYKTFEVEKGFSTTRIIERILERYATN